MKGFCVLIKKEEQGEGEKGDSLYIRPIESGFFDSGEKSHASSLTFFLSESCIRMWKKQQGGKICNFNGTAETTLKY